LFVGSLVPAKPVFASRYSSPDHLHPNDLGYSAMADAIDLALFR
jgi:lysophospholipase L1-like esterase